MKNVKKISAMLIAAGLLTLSGCSGLAADGNSLLRPPRPTGDKAAIQEIIAREAGGTYNLKYPQKGVNRSAITLRNENTDNEYALALYSTENDTKLNVSIIAYDQAEWKCLGTYTNNSSGVDRVLFYDINSDKREEIIIGWTNYNSAHKSLTAYSMDSEEVYEMTVDETYDELAIADMTNDAADDIVLLSLSTQDTPSVATLLQYSDLDKRPVGKYSLELDSEVIAFSNIVVGDVATNTEIKPSEVKLTASSARVAPSDTSDDDEDSQEESSRQENTSKEEGSAEESADVSQKSGDESSSDDKSSADESSEAEQPSETTEPEQSEESENSEESSKAVKPGPKKFDANAVLSKKGIVVDCKRSDNTFCTQMIYYDNLYDELIDPISRKNDGSTYINPTLRTEAVFSRDINGDDVIEVPVSVPMNAAADESGAAVCNLTSWCNYDARERKTNVAMNTVMNLKDGYYFVMPERWLGSVTARSDAETREMTFYLWNTKTSTLGDKLLLISRCTEQQWKESDHSGKILLKLSPGKSKAVYSAVIYLTSADEALNITESELQDSVFMN
ncbi:MAG: hypothetical protein IJU51_03875 [Clostridia bacterium]|nr:hypothetical protein [Clostridia bacterium]